MKNANPNFLTCPDLAKMLGQDPRTTQRWAKRGYIPGLVSPIGHARFHKAAIEAWVELGCPLNEIRKDALK